MCDDGVTSETEPALRRADFFQWKRRDITTSDMSETAITIDNKSKNIETEEAV